QKQGILENANVFPTSTDYEFTMSGAAANFYKEGPSLLYEYVPFHMIVYVRWLITLAVTAAAIFVPVFNYFPSAYVWFVRERMQGLYVRLRALEADLNDERKALPELARELDDIDQVANTLGVPMRYSDLLYSLKSHIDTVRIRIAARQ